MSEQVAETVREEHAGIGARVLIVDDHKTNLLKMSLAVKKLGHEAICRLDGPSALEELSRGAIDIVLLDIVMPGMSGFEVLQAMKSSVRLRDIPVIVVSSLDDDMGSVVRGIELGAEDFLPKDFDPILLKARVGAGIEKKRLRDLELEYLRQVDRLTMAAAVLETGNFNPKKLGIQDVSGRGDALGKLARVLLSMAQQVYERERAFRGRIATLRGGFILLAIGALYGLLTPLSRVASFSGAHPWALSFWMNLLGGATLIAISLSRGRLKRVARKDLRYLIALGAIGSLAEVLLFWATANLPASTVAMILAMDNFLVFTFASATGIESADFRRLFGVFLGVAAVSIIIFGGHQVSGGGSWVWYLAALAVPAIYALVYILIATRLPTYLDLGTCWGIVMAISAATTLPIVWLTGDFATTSDFVGDPQFMFVILMMTGIVTVGGVLTVVLTKSTGSVFASQCSYAITFFGIAWSVLLLRESISLWNWVGLALMVLGLAIVGPKQEAELEPPAEFLDDASRA